MAHYDICVLGTVPAAELGELDGMAVSSCGACLRLSGEVVDPSALHGILARLTGLGLTLVEVVRAGVRTASPDVVRLRGRAGSTLSRRFPHLTVREERDVTEVTGPLHDDDLLDLLGMAPAMRLDVLEVRRTERPGPTPVA